MSDLNREYYAKRAETARKLAETATDPEIRAIHERMAKDYEELAALTAGKA